MRTLKLLGAPVVAAALLAGPGPAFAETTTCTTSLPVEGTRSTDVSASDDARNPALGVLRLPEVHRLATGRGVGVAVIDSGVEPGEHLAVTKGVSFVGTGQIRDGHGTIVAGLIAGGGDVSGLAPDADIVSLRVSAAEPDRDDPQPGTVSSVDVARAVDWVVANKDRHRIGVINLSLGFAEADPAVTAAIEAAVKAGIVVVAAAGNRPPDRPAGDDEATLGPANGPANGIGDGTGDGSVPDMRPDEVLFPATLQSVIAVTGRAEDLTMTTENVLVGPEIDVSAPVVGLRSLMLGQIVCDIAGTASSWATAEVSALAALILEREPAATPAQVRTRIQLTAQGGLRDSATDGHGMIQPYEALTAVLDIARDGTLRNDGDGGRARHVAPRPQEVGNGADGGSRSRLLWWGVGAGGVLLLALIVRPLTVRRRN